MGGFKVVSLPPERRNGSLQCRDSLPPERRVGFPDYMVFGSIGDAQHQALMVNPQQWRYFWRFVQ
jgi:hypothetical protein